MLGFLSSYLTFLIARACEESTTAGSHAVIGAQKGTNTLLATPLGTTHIDPSDRPSMVG